jgi:hypothetical protein
MFGKVRATSTPPSRELEPWISNDACTITSLERGSRRKSPCHHSTEE